MKIIIFGGTGTFGKEILKQLSCSAKFKEIIVISRDELKQAQLMGKYPNVKFLLGDIRDKKRIDNIFEDNNINEKSIVIHAAALKRVDKCESNIEECIKTNIFGSQNVAEICKKYRIKKAIAISTDKAVKPINAYGASKLLLEKIFLDNNFSICRYGNVAGSRGSLIEKIKNNEKLYITSLEMTRFWIRIQDAVKFVLESLVKMKGNEIFIPNLKSASLKDILNFYNIKKYEIIGIQKGEKLHESITLDLSSKEAEKLTIDEMRTIFL